MVIIMVIIPMSEAASTRLLVILISRCHSQLSRQQNALQNILSMRSFNTTYTSRAQRSQFKHLFSSRTISVVTIVVSHSIPEGINI